MDAVVVEELQRVVWQNAGAFTVTSETHVTNITGAGGERAAGGGG